MFLKNCPICLKDSLAASNILLLDGPLLVCKHCGHMVSSCSKERYDLTMQEFNTAEGALPNAATSRRNFNLHSNRLKLVQRALDLPTKSIYILDIGCSSGSFLKSARKLGFNNIAGVEPAQAAAKTAREFGFNIYEGGVEHKDIPKNYFNVLTLFEVIEHINNPIQTLKQCRNILKPGGILVIGTGNTDSWTQKINGNKWEYYDINKHGGHISFFSTHSMRTLAENTGFEVINLKTRCVKFFEKNETTYVKYKLSRILTELLNFPAQLAGKGHSMLVIMKIL